MRQDRQVAGAGPAEAAPPQPDGRTVSQPCVIGMLRAQALAATEAARRARGLLLDQPRQPGPARLG